MQEFLSQLQSPWWWAAAVITGVVGNLAWVLLAWLSPRVVRNAVPAARVMLCGYAAVAVVAIVYCAVMLPPGWSIYPQQDLGWFADRVLLPFAISMAIATFLGMVALCGPTSAQLVAATVYTCWAGLMIHSAATYKLSDPALIRAWVILYVYACGAFMLVLVTVPFLPFTVRAVERQLERAVGRAA